MKLRRLTDLGTQQGFILPVLVITTLAIMLIVVAVNSTATLDYQLSTREIYRVNAQLTADAGLDKALIDLTADTNWTGSGSEITLLDTPKLKTTYETVVSNGTTSARKIIDVTARSYSPSTATTPKITRKYQVDVEAVTSGVGPSSVVSGVGGLVLNSNAKISGGDVVVNGKIALSNNSQIGLSTNPVNVRVAHQSCPSPANSTYPQVCSSSSGQPITLAGTAKIYGDVRATNQTNGTNMSNPGLVPNQTVEPLALEPYDRAGHIAAVATTLAPTHSTIACGNNASRTWPANVKITGNITLGNNCTVTLSGNTWVTGNVTMGNNARFVVANTLGTTRPTFMIDGGDAAGTGGFRFGNNSSIVPNSSNTGLQIISFWSAASCSPECSSVTGTDLANSQSVLTIDLSNNGSAQNSVLRAMWTKVRIANNGALGAVAGETVELGNNAVISFSASIPGSDNLITTWVKRGYMREFN